jgi:hypothetical protein
VCRIGHLQGAALVAVRQCKFGAPCQQKKQMTLLHRNFSLQKVKSQDNENSAKENAEGEV